MKFEFTAIILASGFSKRFKYGNKLIFKYEGKPIVEHVMDAIKKCKRFKDIILVSSYDDILDLAKIKGFIFIKNIYHNEGIASSIRLGVENSKDTNYMFFVGDQPGLDENLINKLLENFNGEDITVPVFNGEFKNPVIFPNKFKSKLLDLKGDIGGRVLIKECTDKVKEVKILEERYFKDIDTVEDYYEMERLIVIRGAGDIATGVIQKLLRAGFKVIAMETRFPSAIRRSVSLCQCMYDGEATVEDIVSKRIDNIEEAWEVLQRGKVPVLNDEECVSLNAIRPMALIDAILAKKNLGTNRNMAPITIGLGPGFCAKEDVDVVIETNRGHDLGKLIFDGPAKENTGFPGEICGVSLDRVIYATSMGTFKPARQIGDIVKKDEVIGEVIYNNKTAEIVRSKLDGVLRGIIQDGFLVKPELKIADVDPRMSEKKNCFSISDKARCIGGAVLEALIYLERRKFVEK